MKSPRILHRLAFLVVLAVLCGPPGRLRAAIQPAPIFQNGAVLQRQMPLPVWGTAAPGEKVTVRFAGQVQSAVADPAGKWRVTLDSLAGSSTPATLIFEGHDTLQLHDIVVGEVWLASGQSNMEWIVANSTDADLERLTARFPLVRELTVARTTADSPAATVAATWNAATPDTVAKFGAVSYFFARELHLALDGVPVGIIKACWGATPVESWMSDTMLARDPGFAVVQQRWADAMQRYPRELANHQGRLAEWQAQKSAAQAEGRRFNQPEPRAPDGPDSPRRPASLYNGMIAPLVPAAFRGALWYQGEANATRASEYHPLFSALIEGWRRDFQQGDFPFYWVQLASFRAGGREEGLPWAQLREAQTRTLTLPATGQAVAIDAGTSDANDIHPRNKLAVGRRLARLALARTYGFKGLADSGPRYAGLEFIAATADGSAPAALRLTFSPAGRRLRHAGLRLTGFEVAGPDRVFHPADARIEEGHVVVSSPAVTDPVAVRYAWRNAPEAGLEDDLGLPVPPFRSDDW